MVEVSSENTSRGGIGFVEALTIAFIVLKLVGEINWSWWLVLLPIILYYSLALIAGVTVWLIDKYH